MTFDVVSTEESRLKQQLNEKAKSFFFLSPTHFVKGENLQIEGRKDGTLRWLLFQAFILYLKSRFGLFLAIAWGAKGSIAFLPLSPSQHTKEKR